MVNGRFIQMLRPQEWLTVAAGLGIAVAIYALLIHPSVRALAELPNLREARQAAQDELVRTRARLQQAQLQLTEGRARLTELGGGPPPAAHKDLQIARLTALAEQCQVKMNQYLPLQTVDAADHRAFIVEFIAQGSFPDIHRLFAAIEATMDFVDVTNFAISAVRSAESSDCLVTWSCRINSLQPDPPALTTALPRNTAAPAGMVHHER